MAKPTPTCACPRCGYDLSGVVDSWTEQCPVQGVCSECGLEFGWKFVLNETFRTDPLFVETATLRLRSAWFVTSVRALNPRRFWKWVKMEYRFRPARIAWCVAAWSAAFWLIGSIVLMAANLGAFHAFGALAPQWWGWSAGTSKEVVIFALWPDAYGWEVAPFFFIQTAAFTLWMTLMPLMYLILGDTLAKAKARWFHVARIAGYQFIAVIPYWLGTILVSQIEQWVETIQNRLVNPSPLAFMLLNTAAPIFVVIAHLTALIVPPLWIAGWWGLASRHYLRIRHAWLVAIVLTATTGLAVFTAILYYLLSTRML